MCEDSCCYFFQCGPFEAMRSTQTKHKCRNLSCETTTIALSPMVNVYSVLLIRKVGFQFSPSALVYHLLCVVVKASLLKLGEKIPTSWHNTSSSAAADRATQTAPPSPAASPDCPRSPAAASSPRRQDSNTLLPLQPGCDGGNKSAGHEQVDCNVWLIAATPELNCHLEKMSECSRT